MDMDTMKCYLIPEIPSCCDSVVARGVVSLFAEVLFLILLSLSVGSVSLAE